MYVLFFYFKFKIKTKYIFKIWDISYHPIFKYFLSIISPIWIINYHLLIFLIFNKKNKWYCNNSQDKIQN